MYPCGRTQTYSISYMVFLQSKLVWREVENITLFPLHFTALSSNGKMLIRKWVQVPTRESKNFAGTVSKELQVPTRLQSVLCWNGRSSSWRGVERYWLAIVWPGKKVGTVRSLPPLLASCIIRTFCHLTMLAFTTPYSSSSSPLSWQDVEKSISGIVASAGSLLFIEAWYSCCPLPFWFTLLLLLPPPLWLPRPKGPASSNAAAAASAGRQQITIDKAVHSNVAVFLFMKKRIQLIGTLCKI